MAGASCEGRWQGLEIGVNRAATCVVWYLWGEAWAHSIGFPDVWWLSAHCFDLKVGNTSASVSGVWPPTLRGKYKIAAVLDLCSVHRKSLNCGFRFPSFLYSHSLTWPKKIICLWEGTPGCQSQLGTFKLLTLDHWNPKHSRNHHYSQMMVLLANRIRIKKKKSRVGKAGTEQAGPNPYYCVGLGIRVGKRLGLKTKISCVIFWGVFLVWVFLIKNGLKPSSALFLWSTIMIAKFK